MPAPALCQCTTCHRYLAKNRDPNDATIRGRNCVECVERLVPGMGGGLPLADVRGPATDPLSVELLGLLTEECGEISQRVGKILRWGWKADHAGTTQQHKLEVELGDIIAAVSLLRHNGLIDGGSVMRLAKAKMAKLLEDAHGPRQRLTVAKVPASEYLAFEFGEW